MKIVCDYWNIIWSKLVNFKFLNKMVYFNFILYFNAKSKSVRALIAVKLNSYIAILVSPKHKNPYYISGVKGKFFTFIATVHIYI